MSQHGESFDRAQRAFDSREHPDFYEDDEPEDLTPGELECCECCIYNSCGCSSPCAEILDEETCTSFKD